MGRSSYEWLIIHDDDTTEKVRAVDIESALYESKDHGFNAIACVRLGLCWWG